MKTHALPFVLLLALSATTACRKPSQETSATNVTSAPAASKAAKPFVPSHPVPPFSGAFPHRPEPAANVSGRVVEATLVGRSDDVMTTATFALKNLTKEPVVVEKMTIFDYDAKKNGNSREQHVLQPTVVLAPGETKQQKIELYSRLAPEKVNIEAEIVVATVGGKGWGNLNLAGPDPRPMGGFDAQTLEDHAGERVIVDVYALNANRVRLTNVTSTNVSKVTVDLFYWDAKGKVLQSRVASSVELTKPLPPGASADVDLKVDDKEKGGPSDAAKVVAFASRVISDGPEFQNASLEDYSWLGIVPK